MLLILLVWKKTPKTYIVLKEKKKRISLKGYIWGSAKQWLFEAELNRLADALKLIPANVILASKLMGVTVKKS